MKKESIIETTTESDDENSLENYLEVDQSMRNPFDQFFTDEELKLLREYAAFFMQLWREQHE
jgi:hypothetical protein